MFGSSALSDVWFDFLAPSFMHFDVNSTTIYNLYYLSAAKLKLQYHISKLNVIKT